MSKLEKKLKTDMRKKMLDTNPSDELYERVKKERLRFIIKIDIQQPEGSSAASRGAG